MRTFILEDPDQCRKAWEANWPVKGLFDLWPVRSCFQLSYERPLSFHLAEQNGRIVGFMPLSWNEEKQNFVQFPGETWQGKTWLEQNQILAESPEVFRALLDSVPGSLHLRYLNYSPLLECLGMPRQDEIGFLFFPRLHDFSMDNFWMAFPGKSRKKLKAETGKLEGRNLTFRFNHLPDLGAMFRMNVEVFNSTSYFSDDRFFHAFERLAAYLWDMGMLRVTTILIEGKLAAVDMGAIFNNTYTLLAGGANPEFPGVAKVINLHHLEWSCHKGFDSVDFLCGNFNWKERFRLTPRPLYEIRRETALPFRDNPVHETVRACA